MSSNQFGKKGWTPDRLGDLSNKTYLITGANSGAGFEASKILLQKGARVVMLNRNETKSEKAINDIRNEIGADAKVSFVKMDLANLDSVRNAAEEVNKSINQIDALICNAAIAQVPQQELTQDGFESHIGVNHYGHFLLCGLLSANIDQSNGRIVMVGSEGYKMGLKTMQFDDMNWSKNYHPMNTYCHSKLAQMMFGYELQDRINVAGKNIKVYVCHPGASATSLIENSGSRKDRILFGLMSKTPLVQSAEKGAFPEVMCAAEEEENLNQKSYYGPTGMMQWIGPVGECELKNHAKDKAVAVKLWKVSEEATSFKWSF